MRLMEWKVGGYVGHQGGGVEGKGIGKACGRGSGRCGDWKGIR